VVVLRLQGNNPSRKFQSIQQPKRGEDLEARGGEKNRGNSPSKKTRKERGDFLKEPVDIRHQPCLSRIMPPMGPGGRATGGLKNAHHTTGELSGKGGGGGGPFPFGEGGGTEGRGGGAVFNTGERSLPCALQKRKIEKMFTFRPRNVREGI